VAEWKGHSLRLNAEGDGYTWEPLESHVRIRAKPFARGGQRNAFHLFYERPVDVPGELRCQLTGALMTDPVVLETSEWAVSNKLYERAAIERTLYLERKEGRIEHLRPDMRSRELCCQLRQKVSRTCDHFVAKEGRFKDEWNTRLSSHKLSMRTAMEAQALADQFNELTPSTWPIISVLPASIYRLAPAAAKTVNPNSYRYVSAEPFLEGAYYKFNGNNGFVGRTASSDYQHQEAIAQTFTHWSYEHSLQRTGSALMVCDIQGVGYQYTDVTLCSEDRRFGSTDLGEKGFEAFFGTHKCNELCGRLGLTHVSPEGADGAAGSSSTATSAIQIIRTKHLNRRKRERDIETREMQAAVKHGRKEPGTGPGSIRHVHNGVAVVTDGEHRVGITTFPRRR